MPQDFRIAVRDFALPDMLRPFFSRLYSYRIETAAGAVRQDCLYPDWAGIHFSASGTPARLKFVGGEPQRCAPFAANGPTSKAICIEVQESRTWNMAITPLGWERFGIGPASAVANQVVDGSAHPAFAVFRPILELVQRDPADIVGTARRIEAFLQDILPPPGRYGALAAACNEALRDPATIDVTAFAARVGVNRRTLERLTARFFGFSPKLLLRRQRFVRSLGRFSIDPQKNWSAALDERYFDQAQFVHEFRAFMGMTPGEFAQMPHPLLDGILSQRLAEQGANAA